MLFLNVLWSGVFLSPDTDVPILQLSSYYTGLPFLSAFLSLPLSLLFPLLSLSVSLFSFLLACCDSNMLMGVGWSLLILHTSGFPSD